MKSAYRLIVLALTALAGAPPALAAIDYAGWVTMADGVAVAYDTPWAPFGGKFTLSQPSVVVLSVNSDNSFGQEDGFALYDSAGLASETSLLNINNQEGRGTYSLPAGTYYFYCHSTWGSGSIMYAASTGGVQPVIESITPESGSVFGATANNGFLALVCDFVVYVDSWQLLSDRYTSPVHALDPASQGMMQMISIYVCDEIRQLHDHGLAAGDSFQIVLNGIRDPQGNRYEADPLVLDYIVGDRPLDLASTSLTSGSRNRLLSYYLPGEESALVTFTFTGPFDTGREQLVAPYIDGDELSAVMQGPVLELACSSTSAAQKLYYSGTYSDGNRTVTFDISGRDFGGWGGALGADGAEPIIKVFNVYDLAGNNSLGCSESLPGAYTFSTDYRMYQHATFDCEWLPAAGSALEEVTAVDIATALSPDDKTGVRNRIRSFRAVTFAAADGQVAEVPFSDCTLAYTDEALGRLTISCPTPQSVRDLPNVTVTVDGLVTCDGLLYDAGMITADFNAAYTDPSPFIDFGTEDIHGLMERSDYATSVASIIVYTDLAYSGDLPTVVCSDPAVIRPVYYVNTTPAHDLEGHAYYFINLGQAVGLTDEGGASAVSDGTTLTVSFPAKAFYNSRNNTVYGPVSHTFTITDTPASRLSAVEAVDEASACTVYTLQGRLATAVASKADLHALPAGLYIVNGRKTLVK